MRTRDVVAMAAWLVYGLGVIAAIVILFIVKPPDDRRVEPVVQTRLVVPVECLDALDHGDDLALLTGEAFGAAADETTTNEELTDLLRRATVATEDYKQAAARCRQTGAQE